MVEGKGKVKPTEAQKANIKSQITTPTGSQTGDLWLDTSQVPNILKFYTGTQWLETSPESSLPTFVASNASQYAVSYTHLTLPTKA